MADANNTRQNLTLSMLGATIVTRFAEVHYGVKLSADDAMAYVSAIALVWHFTASTCGPYAQRVFDHFFPPEAKPPQSKELEK